MNTEKTAITGGSAFNDRCGAEAAHLVIFDRRPGRSWEERLWRRPESYRSLPITVWGM